LELCLFYPVTLGNVEWDEAIQPENFDSIQMVMFDLSHLCEHEQYCTQLWLQELAKVWFRHVKSMYWKHSMLDCSMSSLQLRRERHQERRRQINYSGY
jgi:hypothetical protein